MNVKLVTSFITQHIHYNSQVRIAKNNVRPVVRRSNLSGSTSYKNYTRRAQLITQL